MAIFKRNKIWWLDIEIDGRRYRESTKLTNREAAKEIERARYEKIAKARGGVAERPRLLLFSVAAEKFLQSKKSEWAPQTYVIESFNVRHLLESFGDQLLTDVTADAVSAYRVKRAPDASPKRSRTNSAAFAPS